jgi:hypothetical protein
MTYKILQIDQRTISELDLNEWGKQGWRVLSVAWDKSGAMVSALLERESQESAELFASASKAIKGFRTPLTSWQNPKASRFFQIDITHARRMARRRIL